MNKFTGSKQELLSTLHHHNTNLRKDALLGLLEIVTGQNNLIFLKRNLDKILERVAALTSDLEGIVRRENLKVAEAIFQRVIILTNTIFMLQMHLKYQT